MDGFCTRHCDGIDHPPVKSTSTINENGTIHHSNHEFRDKCKNNIKIGDEYRNLYTKYDKNF